MIRACKKCLNWTPDVITASGGSGICRAAPPTACGVEAWGVWPRTLPSHYCASGFTPTDAAIKEEELRAYSIPKP